MSTRVLVGGDTSLASLLLATLSAERMVALVTVEEEGKRVDGSFDVLVFVDTRAEDSIELGVQLSSLELEVVVEAKMNVDLR